MSNHITVDDRTWPSPRLQWRRFRDGDGWSAAVGTLGVPWWIDLAPSVLTKGWSVSLRFGPNRIFRGTVTAAPDEVDMMSAAEALVTEQLTAAFGPLLGVKS